jgi:hypothetical protein
MAILRENADRLLRKLERATDWPPKGDRKLLEDLFQWIWFREADGDQLKQAHPGGWDEEKPYLVDPLASRIAEAFADLIFGEEPDFQAAKKADQQRLEDLVAENDLASELQQGAELSTSEGEVWWRVRVDRAASDWPMVEFHSRTNVMPLFSGRQIIAIAFIQVIEDDKEAWRYVECHAEGIILNKLYKIPLGDATPTSSGSIIPVVMHVGHPFGDQVSLSDRPETEDLDAVWEHGQPMLAGRIINRRGRTPRVGISQYKRVKDILYSVNEAATIGQQNMRLTARKRAVVDESVLQPQFDDDGKQISERPVFDSQDDVYIASALDENLESKQGPFKILEYSFDAAALVEWYLHLEDIVLTRTRTAPQLVGRHVESAVTGPALRARLLDSMLAANGKARWWDGGVPQLIKCLQLIDKLPIRSGGFGRSWEDANEKPTMRRKSIIPEDPKDEADRHAVLMGSELESQFTAIADMHPEWSDSEIQDEMDRIRSDAPNLGAPNGTINRNINRRQNGSEPPVTDPTAPRPVIG